MHSILGLQEKLISKQVGSRVSKTILNLNGDSGRIKLASTIAGVCDLNMLKVNNFYRQLF